MEPPPFRVIGKIANVEVIARGNGIKQIKALEKRHGKGDWRKLKGIARVQLEDGTQIRAEVHYYEANGIGRRDLKIKRELD